ncbi:type V CRISPR-associated protein Cas4 [Candidatus Dojkabacteria bacterium]|uniref:CRISPR-associated exonuclease Cas4 n=1 Tax=Candidatus Dojkabacteria bacterium TaxID=2099670 RepID=A0A3M0YZ35_9BACT|nr:MAG: type V CRISPR-associated protein Cas4 [Candidatus Dojkabacteria bacterium]
MHGYIQISTLNDFLFDPMSIYFHSVYQSFNTSLYHSIDQIRGIECHKSIDKKTYTSRKDVWQGTPVMSANLGLVGKIDLFYFKEKKLVERKYKIKKTYDGYVMQLVAQAVCLEERGITVKKLVLYSISDNKSYEIEYSPILVYSLSLLISKIRQYQTIDKSPSSNQRKRERCIYKNLYW